VVFGECMGGGWLVEVEGWRRVMLRRCQIGDERRAFDDPIGSPQ
jgi:hypothetical protein